jgi:hypothetical protein
MIKGILWNANSFNSNRQRDLASICSLYGVVSLVETKIPYDVKLPGMREHSKPREDLGGGLKCYVNSKYPSHRRADLELGHDVEVLWVEVDRLLLLATVYRKPTTTADEFKKITESLRYGTDVANSQGMEVVVVGDFNAHDPSWDTKSRADGWGEKIVTLCSETGLVNATATLAPDVITYRCSTGVRESVVDLVLASSGVVRSITVNNTHVLHSDHYPVIFDMTTNTNPPKRTNNSTGYEVWNWGAENGADIYVAAITEQVDGLIAQMNSTIASFALSDQEKTDALTALVTDEMLKAASLGYGKRYVRPGAKTYWSGECVEAIKQCKRNKARARRLTNLGRDDEAKTIVKAARRKKRKKLRRARRKNSRVVDTEASENREKSECLLWKKFSTLGKKKVTGEIDVEAGISLYENIAPVRPEFEDEWKSFVEKEVDEKLSGCTGSIPDLTNDEMRAAIKLAHGKALSAPGDDQVVNVLFVEELVEPYISILFCLLAQNRPHT